MHTKHNAAIASYKHTMLTFTANMASACTYAMRNPQLAAQCAQTAHAAAVAMGKPAMAYQANALLCALTKGKR
jgi:hypothetical protein